MTKKMQKMTNYLCWKPLLFSKTELTETTNSMKKTILQLFQQSNLQLVTVLYYLFCLNDIIFDWYLTLLFSALQKGFLTFMSYIVHITSY